jgi:SAM-dependent methyltransferase
MEVLKTVHIPLLPLSQATKIGPSSRLSAAKSISNRLKGQAIAWGDSFLPPGPMRDRAIAIAKRRGVTFLPSTRALPDHLQIRQMAFSDAQQQALTVALRADYFGAQPELGSVDDFLRTDEGHADLVDHLSGRLERDRATVVPWLDSIKPLSGLRVLEVGAGTGSSTVAIAEQGASVLATDVNERSLKVNAALPRMPIRSPRSRVPAISR